VRFKLLIGGAAILGCTALGLGGPALAAPAATSACAGACTDIHFLVPGEHYLLKDHAGSTAANNVIALTTGSNALSSEDFSEVNVGTVSPQYCEAPPNTSVAQPGSIFTNRQCQLLTNAGLTGATTFEYAFNPNDGGPENMCLGAWDNVSPVPSGYKFRLVACGVSADTVMIVTSALPSGNTTAGSDWLIDGGSDNYSDPLVATNNGGTAWQAPRWETVDVNGHAGEDTQEVRLEPGPFTI
jgi:hypothetical protein